MAFYVSYEKCLRKNGSHQGERYIVPTDSSSLQLSSFSDEYPFVLDFPRANSTWAQSFSREIAVLQIDGNQTSEARRLMLVFCP